MSRLPIQRLRTANDFENFVGNRCLARFVVGELELVSELSGVVSGLMLAVIRAPCSLAIESRSALNNWVLSAFGIKVVTISS